jgi:hypothetical protein
MAGMPVCGAGRFSGPGLLGADFDADRAASPRARPARGGGRRRSAQASAVRAAELAEAYDEGYVAGRVERVQGLARRLPVAAAGACTSRLMTLRRRRLEVARRTRSLKRVRSRRAGRRDGVRGGGAAARMHGRGGGRWCTTSETLTTELSVIVGAIDLDAARGADAGRICSWASRIGQAMLLNSSCGGLLVRVAGGVHVVDGARRGCIGAFVEDLAGGHVVEDAVRRGRRTCT